MTEVPTTTEAGPLIDAVPTTPDKTGAMTTTSDKTGVMTTTPDETGVMMTTPDKTGVMSIAECTQALKTRFPALFGGPVKPLKLRIQVDIQARAPGVFSKQVLSAFFRRHTGSTSYLMAVSKASHRRDLDGLESGEITQEHKNAAADELVRRRQNQVSRLELETQQRQNRAGLLRDFEATTLTQANFCALKGVAVDELDGLLELARSESATRPVPSHRASEGREHAPASDARPPRRRH